MTNKLPETFQNLLRPHLKRNWDTPDLNSTGSHPTAMNSNGLRYKQLYSAYQEAWKRFSDHVAERQFLSSQRDGSSDRVLLARTHVERAELSYREHRNALVSYLFSTSVRLQAKTAYAVDTDRILAEKKGLDLRSAVKRQAHRFWEEGGRQDGHAILDWSRAEMLVYKEA